jgi:hypothetical protein
VERWVVYPVVLWLVGFGGFLGASRRQEPPSVSLPAATAHVLNGHKEAVHSSR